MSFQFSSQGKLREFGKNTKNQGIRSEFVTVTQKGKVFASLVYVRLVPCVQVVFIDWLVIVAFLNITHLNKKVFLIEFWNSLREISGKTQGIFFS